MPVHVIARTDPDEPVQGLQGIQLEDSIEVSCFPDLIESSMSTTIGQCLNGLGLAPHPVATEFMFLAAAAFQADVRVSRTTASDRWTRHFVLHLPVQDPAAWEEASLVFQQALSFLTGDVWELRFRRGAPIFHRYPGRHDEPINLRASRVALFSGGMDSFLGAAKLVEDDSQVVFVGHYASANGVRGDQVKAWEALTEIAPHDNLHFEQFYLSKKRGLLGGNGRSELTTRSRSIVFLGLGILVAASLDPASTLYIPENGFVSLNVPLVTSRIGSLSTRTTHPYFIRLIREGLRRLGIRVNLDLPLRFHTKGMLLEEAPARVRELSATHTVSCAHPIDQRMERQTGYRRHCGYCFPCIIRRASLYRVGLDNPDDYRVDVLAPNTRAERMVNVQAVRAAVHHFEQGGNSTLQVFSAGPLPLDPGELNQYSQVWREGMGELGRWIRRR